MARRVFRSALAEAPRVLGVVLCALVAGSVRAEARADEVLRGLQTWLDATRTLEGRFEQSLVSAALGARVEERGRIHVVRPGRMRWDYLEPERKVATVDGDRTMLYLEAERQVVYGRLGPHDDLLPALLAGTRPLAELFETALADEPAAGDRRAVRLRLRPRSEVEALGEVVVTLRVPDFAVEEAEVLDAAGNRMRYRFTALRRNEPVKASTFEFRPPPGTEVSGAPGER